MHIGRIQRALTVEPLYHPVPADHAECAPLRASGLRNASPDASPDTSPGNAPAARELVVASDGE